MCVSEFLPLSLCLYVLVCVAHLTLYLFYRSFDNDA